MFSHIKQLQYTVRVDCPDPVYARKLQELIGGQFGEMTVMNQYLFQGWNVRGHLEDERLWKLKDMFLDTGTEEIGHIEMLATCVALLLDGASAKQVEEAAKTSGAVYATLGGMNPQHMIVAGMGARPADSVGNPFMGSYCIASGNVVADLYHNATAEMMGRLQACRLYEMTDDTGVRDMLSFLIARDRMHQNQWLAAIEELGGPTQVLPVPISFPIEKEPDPFSYTFLDFSKGEDHASGTGRWAQGPTPDGKGQFSYAPEPLAHGQAPHLKPAPASLHSALLGGPVSPEPPPVPPQKEGFVQKMVDAVTGS